MRKYTLLFLMLFISSAHFSLQAQSKKPSQGKAIEMAYEFTVHGVKDTVIYLANYYGEKLYYADTAYADNKGQFAFAAINPQAEGKFAVVMPGPKYFELIIGDGEKIKMETDTADLILNMKVHASENNKIMYDYVRFLAEKRAKREMLISELQENEGKPEVTARLKEQFNTLNEEVINYQKGLSAKYPNKLAPKEILMSVDVEPPVELLEEREKAYYWYKRNYFNNIDFQDERIVRLPIFHSKFFGYLNETLVQDPDTIIKAIDALVAKTVPDSEVFKYVVHYATYNYETSKIMGMDKVFVHMVDKYYKPGIATWMDDDKLKNIKEKADTKRYTILGNVAPELILMDTSEVWVSTHRDLKNKYVLLYFYDPDCGHCKKETPKLVEFVNNYKGDLAVYAISGNNDDKWLKFIKKNKMPFYNVSIPKKAYEDADYATNLIISKKTNYHSLKYQDHYDVFSTPKLILLDEKRKVRAKDIGVDQLAEIIERLEEAEKMSKKL